MRRSNQLVGARKSVDGRWLIRDPEYLKWLHVELAAGRIKPLDSGSGPVELHHFGPGRRNNDSLVAPISQGLHRTMDTATNEHIWLERYYDFALAYYEYFATFMWASALGQSGAALRFRDWKFETTAEKGERIKPQASLPTGND